MGIPLSRAEEYDKLIWHFTPNGSFSVTSAYEVERRWRIEAEGSNGQSSSGGLQQ